MATCVKSDGGLKITVKKPKAAELIDSALEEELDEPSLQIDVDCGKLENESQLTETSLTSPSSRGRPKRNPVAGRYRKIKTKEEVDAAAPPSTQLDLYGCPPVKANSNQTVCKIKLALPPLISNENSTPVTGAREQQQQHLDSSTVQNKVDEEDFQKCGVCGRDDQRELTYGPGDLLYGPDEDDHFWICCDNCEEWYHGRCVDVQEYQEITINRYHCPKCQEAGAGESQLHEYINDHRFEYWDNTADRKPTQIGTKRWIHEFMKTEVTTFPCALQANVLDVLEDGHNVEEVVLGQKTWERPVLIKDKTGLELSVPDPAEFGYDEVEQLVGRKRMVAVVDVYYQHTVRMSLERFMEVMKQKPEERVRLYNILSLEFSDSRLAKIVQLPGLVRKMSWVHQFWPDAHVPKAHDTSKVDDSAVDNAQSLNSDNSVVSHEHLTLKPEVSMFCLLSMAGSWTDWHIDFGGSSVWYHILKGEKIFYVVAPTDRAIELHEQVLKDNPDKLKIFSDVLPKDIPAYRIHLKPGHTLLIPAGWIHMVYTPVDSLVFGGNFLHYSNVKLQFQCEEMERGIKIGDSFLFPRFELTNWYAAQRLVELWHEHEDEKKRMPKYLIEATAQLIAGLEHRKSKIYGKERQLIQDMKKGILVKQLKSCLARSARKTARIKAGGHSSSGDSSPASRRSPVKGSKSFERLPKSPSSKDASAPPVGLSLKLSKGNLIVRAPIREAPKSAPPVDSSSAEFTGKLKMKIPRLASVSEACITDVAMSAEQPPQSLTTSASCSTALSTILTSGSDLKSNDVPADSKPSSVVASKSESSSTDIDDVIGYSLEDVDQKTKKQQSSTPLMRPSHVPCMSTESMVIPIAVRHEQMHRNTQAEESTVVASLSSDLQSVSSRGRVRKAAAWVREAAEIDQQIDLIDNFMPSTAKASRLVLKNVPTAVAVAAESSLPTNQLKPDVSLATSRRIDDEYTFNDDMSDDDIKADMQLDLDDDLDVKPSTARYNLPKISLATCPVGAPKPLTPGAKPPSSVLLKTKGALKMVSTPKPSPKTPTTAKQRLGAKLGLFKKR